MTEPSSSEPPDLTGAVDERIEQLARVDAAGDVSAAWLRRQLDLVLAAWAEDATQLDIDTEARADY